jgi:hypothetical protein
MNGTAREVKRKEKRAKLEAVIKKFQAQGVKIGFCKNVHSIGGLEWQSYLRQAD